MHFTAASHIKCQFEVIIMINMIFICAQILLNLVISLQNKDKMLGLAFYLSYLTHIIYHIDC